MKDPSGTFSPKSCYGQGSTDLDFSKFSGPVLNFPTFFGPGPVLNQSVLVRGSLFMGMVVQDRNSWAALIRSIGFSALAQKLFFES